MKKFLYRPLHLDLVLSLSTTLNQARIVNKDGHHILFNGQDIGTRLQKSGNDCIRLAALYLRQIILENDLDAYQKVNGAFVDGALQKFEDISKIKDARKISLVEPSIDRDRDRFMHSWDHRNHNMLHEKEWRGIRVGDLRSYDRGGREEQTDALHLWTIKTYANPHQERVSGDEVVTCSRGFGFFRAEESSVPVFARDFPNLDALRAAANTHNPEVQRVVALDIELESLIEANGQKGIFYVRDSNELFVVTLR